MIEHDVNCDDMLLAMSQNLVETHDLYRVPRREDPELVLKTNLKPPREVFYRQTVTFSTKLPKNPPPRRCTCMFLCTGAAATMKCMTCSLYDVTGHGYYCQMCFDHRHPWHRVPHIFTTIEKDENIAYTMSVQHRKAETIRYLQEGRDILHELVKGTSDKLEYVADDIKIDKDLRRAGRRSVALEDRLLDLRHTLRADLRSGPYKHVGERVPFDEFEARVVLQRALRGYRVRKIISLLFVERTIRVWDMHMQKEYYHDTVSGRSSWVPPRLPLTIRPSPKSRTHHT